MRVLQWVSIDTTLHTHSDWARLIIVPVLHKRRTEVNIVSSEIAMLSCEYQRFAKCCYSCYLKF